MYLPHPTPFLLLVPALSDEALMTQVRAGDLDQLVPLFERYQGPLFGFLYRLTRDREQSQDLTQNVFYRVLKYRASYQPAHPFRAWVYQLARHVYHDHYERTHCPDTTLTDLETAERTPAHVRAAHDQRATLDQTEALTEALTHLPLAQREILVLHRFQGFGYAEIGELLGCSEGAARVKAHRAMEALRAIYFEES